MAGSLLTETFTYPDGDLSGQVAWPVYSGTPPTDIKIVSGRANGNIANAPDDHTAFTAQSTLSTTYACFKVKISSPTPAYGRGRHVDLRHLALEHQLHDRHHHPLDDRA